MDRSIKSL